MAGANDFDHGLMVDNRWGGVINGVVTGLPGSQKAVNDYGSIVASNPGPSVAIGDLNGDGLPDIVMGDARGFFWFFPNSGTKTQPKFTYGEVMPIWLSNPDKTLYYTNEGQDNTVPRMSLVDYDKDGKLDIVAGNYEGKLFFIHNNGSKEAPNFRMPEDLADITIPTYSLGKLWCNFLAPTLYDWRGGGILDLIMGEGTYASNSIYLLTNKGSNESPTFNEAFTTKIIPGLGREHLTPQVVDWNNDGKPDIITGERAGHIDVFLNTTTDPAHPQFDQGQQVSFGGADTLGQFTTVAVGDLTGNKLPNLLISNSSNQLLYAENKGTLGHPQFGTPMPIMGKNPLPKIQQASNWGISKALGIPYVNLICTNKLVEPDFTPPSPEFKSALKYYTEPHTFNTDFPNQFFPVEDTQMIGYRNGVTLKPHTHYTLSFWVKTVGDVGNFIYGMEADYVIPKGSKKVHIFLHNPITPSESWTHFSDSVTYDFADDTVKETSLHFSFWIAFNSHPTLYFDGFSMTEEP